MYNARIGAAAAVRERDSSKSKVRMRANLTKNRRYSIRILDEFGEMA
jgi:hypothetical protein